MPVTRLHRHWLRHAVLLVLVDAGRVLTVAEIVEELRRRDLAPFRTPASRAVSDAMRWDIRAGRIERVGWGRYVATRPTAGHVAYARRVIDDAVLGRGRGWRVAHANQYADGEV